MRFTGATVDSEDGRGVFFRSALRNVTYKVVSIVGGVGSLSSEEAAEYTRCVKFSQRDVAFS